SDAQMSAPPTPDSPTVLAGGSPVVTRAFSISTTTGDSAGTQGVNSSPPSVGGPVSFISHSGTVFAEGSEVVRMFDQTDQNNGNAVGVVLGGFPTVLVGD
ncbi:MAG: PAAR-like domain-containing protein, partial [Geminicoccaceae bacterium]